MKKNLLLFTVIFFYACNLFGQTLYTSTLDTSVRYNPGSGVLGTPILVFDDVLIPSSQVQGTDSIRITKIKYGIRRLADAPAISVSLYYTLVDDTATLYDNFIKIPPVFLGTINLPENGPTSVTEIVSLGDSITPLFTIKTEPDNLYTGFQTLFLGLSFSDDPTGLNGWRVTIPRAPNSANDDAMWIYDVDDSQTRFATYFGGDPPATFYLQVFGGVSTLPVTLSKFTASRSGKVNLLNWSTSQELNTSHFIVERSTNGTNYSPIAKVAATGNSSMVNNYSYTDIAPAKGINYYRLQVVDKDNASKFSLVRSIRNAGFSDISIYPNPVKNDLTVAINADNDSRGQMVIRDISGKIVLTSLITVTKGNNVVPVNTAHFSSGAYIININLDNDPVVLKFTKE